MDNLFRVHGDRQPLYGSALYGVKSATCLCFLLPSPSPQAFKLYKLSGIRFAHPCGTLPPVDPCGPAGSMVKFKSELLTNSTF